MQLHLVGGFLGSGKTTAIAAASRKLMDDGLRVGVVTNDQGKYLVDSAFVRWIEAPTVEVTGGCFCCNYDDLDARLDELIATIQPDVIFAESVGSCADVVATVVEPLRQLKQTPASFSVFADSRLLLHRLRDEPLPFSDNVIYIFDQQIAEAGLLVVNKIDLLSPADRAEVLTLAAGLGKPLLTQNALHSVDGWLDLLQSGQVGTGTTLSIDYDRYGDGEAQLAWVDMVVEMHTATGRDRLIRLFDHLLSGMDRIGHLKAVVEGYGKISFTAIAAEDWQEQVPQIDTDTFRLLLNARVETGAAVLEDRVRAALAACGAEYTIVESAAFHPGFPSPTHRYPA
jgi:Ni2+-binding GTPase involved in maturation of urease and hydrogenase